MARDTTTTTDTCRQPGDGAGIRAHAATHASAVDKGVRACGGESQASFEW